MSAYPTYVPDFKLQINDSDMPAALKSSVTSVRYQDGLNAADRVEVGFANVNLRWLQEHIRGLGFSALPTGVTLGPIGRFDVTAGGSFDIDNKVTLNMGYAGNPLAEMFTGSVTGVDVTFPNGGVPSMTLVAHDYLNRLAPGKYARGFGPLADALVVMILSAENLLIPLIDPTITTISAALSAINFIFRGTGTKQEGESDLELLTKIAAQYDADFWVDGHTLYLSRFMKDYSPTVTLTWGSTLSDFSPRVSTVGQVAGVSMKFTLREIPLDFLVTVGWDFDRETLIISVIPGVAAAGAKSVVGPAFSIIDQPISSPADIANSALVILHELRTKLNNRVTGSGSCVGNPLIRANEIIRLEGLGPDFSGNYRIKSATHSIDGSGYKTNFQVFKEIIP
jgi:Bacteriophage probable baseplate hub protein